MDELAAAVNEAMNPVIGEACELTDNGVDIRLNEVGWTMLSLGWFAPAARPDHERIDV